MAKKPRIFQQERSERTYRSLLAAAAKVFPKKGFEGTQMPDVARAAGVSVGAVYRYFEDKRELFLEMIESELATARADVTARLAPEKFLGASPEAAIDRVLDVMFDRIQRDPALTKVYLAMALTDRDVARIREEGENHDRAALAGLLASALPGRVADPAAAALLLERAVTAVAVDCAIGSKTVDEKAAKAELRSMILRYLFATG